MGKIAIVTGSTKGIGLAIAKYLLKDGCFVFMNYANDINNAEVIKKNLHEEGYKNSFHIIRSELSTLAETENFVQEIEKKSKDGIDYIILNAGRSIKTPFLELKKEEWDMVMDTNVTMPFFLIQKLFTRLKQNGRIIFIGSVLGIYPHAISIPYGVSKASVHFLAKMLVKECAEKKITVNAIATGFSNTLWQKEKTDNHRKKIEDKIALHRFGDPNEIAKLCCSIIDNEFINGSVISIDGGYDYR